MLVQTHARPLGMGGGIGSPIYRHRSRIILALQIVESPPLDTLLVQLSSLQRQLAVMQTQVRAAAEAQRSTPASPSPASGFAAAIDAAAAAAPLSPLLAAEAAEAEALRVRRLARFLATPGEGGEREGPDGEPRQPEGQPDA